METQVIAPIYSEGKVAFASPTEAINTQLALLSAGFRFESENQQPRPTAYGIMWRREWVGGTWVQSMRTAGNQAIFKAYGAHRKDSIYNHGEQAYNNEEGRRRQREISQEQQARAEKTVNAILEYLEGLGYDPNARNTKKGKPIRIATWTAFIHLLNEVSPQKKPYQIRMAMIKAVKSPPEWVKMNELLKNSRPAGLDVSEVLRKL